MSTKPGWDEAPDWANALCMDEDGRWFWYENAIDLEAATYAWFTDGGRYEEAASVLPKHLWRQSKEMRP